MSATWGVDWQVKGVHVDGGGRRAGKKKHGKCLILGAEMGEMKEGTGRNEMLQSIALQETGAKGV